jgi:hypothetical protein
LKKVLRVQMSDGTVYEIPALIIAEHRADFFEDNSAKKLTYHASSVQPRLRSAEIEFALKNDLWVFLAGGCVLSSGPRFDAVLG